LPLSDIARDLHDREITHGREAWLGDFAEFEDVFEQLGVQVGWVDVTPEFPWQASTRDFGVNTPDGVLIGRFRYQERKGEEEVARQSLQRLGETILPERITRGCMEGGDCFWLDRNTLIIGSGNRSTISGVENAKAILSKYGRRVFVVEFLAKWNHLDVIFSPIAHRLAIVCRDAVPEYLIGFLDALGWELIKVPAEHAHKNEINMLALGDGKVLSFHGNRLNRMLRARGLEVFDPAFTLLPAAGEGPHCLSFELEREE